jgi:hypothetical protein
MTDRFDSSVRDWLAARAPREAPDRILDAVAGRIDDLEQRTSRPWLGLAVAAGIAALIVAGSLVSAGLIRVGPAPSVPPIESGPTVIGCDTSPCEFPLVEGSAYVTDRFAVPIEFTAPGDQWIVAEDLPGVLRLEIGRDARRRILIVTDPSPVHPDGEPTADLVDDAASFAAWLRGRDLLTVSTPREASIGGLDGLAVDVIGQPDPQTKSDGCVDDELLCTAAFGYAGRPADERIFGIHALDALRLYLLDTPESLLVVAVQFRHADDPMSDLDPATFIDGEAADLLETLRILGLP